jgi:radical SAM superfamily enzyme YgiQ (UPF0313 family)
MQKVIKETYLYTPAVKKPDAVDVYCCFPSTYYVGMSSLGYLGIYYLLDARPEIKPHRVFTDTENFNISKNALMSFSFSFELDFLQIFKMLTHYNIPLKKEVRDEKHPLIFAGGPVITANPEPFADFFDFFVIGDAEDVIIDAIMEIYENQTFSKIEKLEKLARIKGIYVPEFYDVQYNKDFTINNIHPIRSDLDKEIIKATYMKNDKCIHSSILTENTVFSNTFLVEVERGCSAKCHFCVASYLNLPVRMPPEELIIEVLEKGLKYTRKIGLLGALITEHPQFENILDYLYLQHQNEPIKLTTSSLRADKINDKIAAILHACDQKQITISVEAGSENLRNKINKQLSNDAIYKCIETCLNNNIRTIKMYAMVGLPEETNSDIEEMIDFIKGIKTKYSSIEVILSLNSFIPKAHTPYQRKQVVEYSECKARMDYIKKNLLKYVKVRVSSSKWDAIQAVLSRGDRRLGDILINAYNYGNSLGSFNRAFKEVIDRAPSKEWYANRARNAGEILPWEHIQFK